MSSEQLSCRFRVLDTDGDGMLTCYEIEQFYDEQLQRMKMSRYETIPLEDCICQMLIKLDVRILRAIKET